MSQCRLAAVAHDKHCTDLSSVALVYILRDIESLSGHTFTSTMDAVRSLNQIR